MPASALPPLVAALLQPRAYPHPVTDVRLVQTHISYVLIAGEHVYKLKKPLDLGFLDFRTLDARRIACEREVALNSRLCAEAYLGVVPIIEMPEGPAIGESAEGREPIEWAVHMRRLPDASFLDRRLADGRVPANTAALLAERLVEFHEAAATNDEVARYGSVELIAANWQENFDQVRPYIGRTIAQADFDSLVSYVDRVLREDAGTFARRAKRDRVRDGHGDLRCDSVSLGDDGSLCIIDCIEFNDRFRYADVASDLAFLLMDLDRLGASWLADEVLTQYLARSFDESLPLVLPFYRCYRAFVRGKVHGFEMDEAEIPAEQRARAELTARRCFDLALSYASTRRDRPLVMAMCGEVGTGKSHIAAALAGRVGAALLRSDVVRKEVAGLPPTARIRSGFDEGLYSARHQARTFNALFARAHRYLGDGHNVVLDATFARRDQRRRARNLAHRSGADYVVIECVAPPEVIIQRLHQRAAESVDASDATVEVYERLHGRYQPVRDDEGPAIRVDTTLPLGETLPLILAALAESPPRNASPPSPWWHS